MKIEKNKVVALSYTLIADGKVADSATNQNPLEYIHGTNMLLPKFEEAVEGLEPGETYSFTLSAKDGYGEYNPKYRFDIPIETFMADGVLRTDLLTVGRVLPLLNSAGEVVQGTVAEVKDNAVTMDFNHPMAGKTLEFSGTIVSVREATEKELKEGLHGEYLPHEGGCHGGHCGGGCHGGHCGGEGHEKGHCCGGHGEGHGDGGHCCHKEN